MRVAFGHFGSDNDISGVTTWLAQLMESLVERGWEVHCIVQYFGDRRGTSEIYQRGTRLGVQFHWISGKAHTEKATRQTLRHLDAIQPDIFLPQVLISMHYAALQAKELGLPFVYVMHSDDPVYWGMLDELHRRGFTGPVVCVSEFIRARILSRYPNLSCQVIAYGVPCDGSLAKYCTDPFRIVFSGRLEEEQKQATVVAKTMVRLCRAHASVECRIIGDGASRAAIEQLVAEAGLQRRIQLLGRLPVEDARRRMAECQALLLLSRFEGLPLAVLEALSLGVVPICREIDSGIPELVKNGQTGFLVRDGEREVEQAVGQLLNQPELWANLSGAGRSLIESRFSRSRCNDAWLELIQGHARPATSSSQPYRRAWKPLPPVNPLLLNYDFRAQPMIKRIYRKVRRMLRQKAA